MKILGREYSEIRTSKLSVAEVSSVGKKRPKENILVSVKNMNQSEFICL